MLCIQESTENPRSFKKYSTPALSTMLVQKQLISSHFLINSSHFLIQITVAHENNSLHVGVLHCVAVL